MTFRRILLHLTLFIATFFTTTVAGVAWLNIDPFNLSNFSAGLPYSVSILFILTCHEFGHYFAAKYHGVEATLPFYIPFPLFPAFILNPFGTMGAVIRTKSHIPTKKVLFDIGVWGPIAGFFATIVILIYGLTHLPGKEFIVQIHPDYFTKPEHGKALTFGSSIIYNSFVAVFTNSTKDFVPPMSEIYHYPYLCAGWFGLFVTALNLIPIGQSDGGHISYAMFGINSRIVTFTALIIFVTLGTIPLLNEFGISVNFGSISWLLWPLIMFALNRGSLNHPEIDDDTEIGPTRILLGYFALFIFVISLMPTPISEVLN